MIKKIPACCYVKMPWKNGMGMTEEIIRVDNTHQAGFLWRLSKATVKEDGDFSFFTGYQRIISVLEGAGMRLTVDGQQSKPLSAFESFAFSGDAQVSCHLLDGPLTDFNLIYDHQKVDANLVWCINAQTLNVECQELLVIFNNKDAVNIKVNGANYTLEQHDAFYADFKGTLTHLQVESKTPYSPATFCTIKINHKKAPIS